jgi:hypothetical protein
MTIKNVDIIEALVEIPDDITQIRAVQTCHDLVERELTRDRLATAYSQIILAGVMHQIIPQSIPLDPMACDAIALESYTLADAMLARGRFRSEA